MTIRRRILVVEDDVDARDGLSHLLESAGYDVLTAGDGEEAANYLMQGIRPRLMVVDLRLPRVSGTEFLRYIQDDADLRMIPRIVVTALDHDDVHVVADAIFHKPCDVEEVLATVRRLAPPGAF
ncbi:MAG: response regulator [Vicinamibacterales bacterium]